MITVMAIRWQIPEVAEHFLVLMAILPSVTVELQSHE